MLAPKALRSSLLRNVRSMSASTVYKFSVSQQDLDTVKATLPAVATAGVNFTKHFYKRMFTNNPELMDLFNQANQAKGGQPRKLLKTVVVAAQAAITVGELPGEAIEGICQKHAALNLQKEAYDIVGTNILGTIEEMLTSDKNVLDAWGRLYGDIANVFITREAEIYDEIEATPGGWKGKRGFELVDRELVSENIARLKFKPLDGKPTPIFKPGKYTTVWTELASETQGPYGMYSKQPRHYTLAMPRNPEDAGKFMSVSVKKMGLVSSMLHEVALGTKFDLSAPFGCFDLSGVEKLWLSEVDAPVVFLSAGVGITPVLAMLESIYVTRPATWLHAEPNGNVHAYRDRLREIAAVRDHQLIRRVWYEDPTEQDGKPGDHENFNMAKYHYQGRMDLPHGNETSVLHLDNPKAQYYMCGPPGFMEQQTADLKSLGVEENRIHTEGF